MENHAAPLKGEFSRVDFKKKDNIDNSNAIVLLDTMLPGEISNLNIRDQVGKITTSKAKRKGDMIGEGLTRTPHGSSLLFVRRVEVRLEHPIRPVSRVRAKGVIEQTLELGSVLRPQEEPIFREVPDDSFVRFGLRRKVRDSSVPSGKCRIGFV